MQYAQPLASRSRPSWSRPTRGETQGGAGVGSEPPGPSTDVGQKSVGRTCDGDAGHCRKTHGLSLLRGLVSTVLTLTGSASVRPAGIVEILRFLSGVQPRFGG